MASSSEDDVPLVQRPGAILLGKKRPLVLVDSSDGGSPLPSWLGNNKSPGQKIGPIDLSSDSDIKEIISPLKLLSPLKAKPPAPSGQAEEATSTQPAPQQAAAPHEVNPPQPQQQQQRQDWSKEASPAARRAAAGPSQPPATTPPTVTAPPKPRAGPAARGGLASSSHSLPVVLPDKLSQLKFLVELESTEELHGATDLSGDSGAIGRMRVQGVPGGQHLQIDLKGVLYNASIVPSPCTMAVVNVGASEAKVECVFSEFVQLREDPAFADATKADAFEGLFGEEEDDDMYAAGGEEEGKAAGSRAGGGRGRRGAKAPAAARKPRGGKAGKVAKPRAKPKIRGGGRVGRGGRGGKSKN